METNFDKIKQEPNAGNHVIERGYEIYDEWVKHRYSSRKIVRFTERVVASLQAQRASAVCFEALSCLFALDIRIQKKYNCFLKCIFSYFSWRRETCALKKLKRCFSIPNRNQNIPAAIEVELQRWSQNLEVEKHSDEDDTIRGGNSSEKNEALAASAKKEQSQATNHSRDAFLDIEETKESASQKADEILESAYRDGSVEKIKTQSNTEGVSREDISTSGQEKSERNSDTLKKTKTYNNGIASPMLYEHKMTDNAKSLMNEVIMDNAGKSKVDVAERNPPEDAKPVWETSPGEDVSNEKSKNIDNDAYLYDEMLTNDRGDAAQQIKKIIEAESVEIDVSAQNGKVAANKQEDEDLRVPIQVDITLDQENEIRKEINRSMSVEAIQAIYESQAEAMREQLTIASAEFGIDAPVEIVGKQKTTKIEHPGAVSNRK